MKISPSMHLCYCFNNFREMNDFTDGSGALARIAELRRLLEIPPEEKFAVGLWINAELLRKFEEPTAVAELKSILDGENLYVFTFNIFPYGQFHGTRVKKNVYLPDWTSQERLDYTCRAASFLAKLMPEGMAGSLSTLPGSYGIPSPDGLAMAAIRKNLLSAAEHMERIYEYEGRDIVLAVEPEPDCLWSSAAEFADLWRGELASAAAAKRHIGICYDASHHELAPGPAGSGLEKCLRMGMRIGKIHLSAALGAPDIASKDELAEFADEVYLHQTKVFAADGTVSGFPDLPDAVSSADRRLPWKIHYHLPIFGGGLPGGLRTEKAELLYVLELLKSPLKFCSNIEIETYTYSVLPPELRGAGVEEFMAKEYRFVLDYFADGK